MSHPGSTPSDAALFTAIRAQLSVASLTLERVTPTEQTAEGPDLGLNAPRLAAEHTAALVFWIEDKDPCQIHFFVPNDGGGQFSSRTIEVDLSNQTSRNDVIAVVAAIIIEGLIFPQPSKPKTSPSAQVGTVKKEATEGKPRRIEIHAAYAGSFVATRMLSHGGTLGFGVFPLRRLFVAVSYSPYAPTTFSNEALRINLISRQVEAHAAARLFLSPLEIRLGVSYSADFRSFSTTAVGDTIYAREDGFNTIHSFVPFLFTAWTYRERIGIFGKIGASFAINETVFRIHRTSGEFTEELEPFDVKLVYQLGLLIRF